MTHAESLILSHHQSCHSSPAHARTHTHTLSTHSREVGEKEEKEGTREVAEMSDQIPVKTEGEAGRGAGERRE